MKLSDLKAVGSLAQSYGTKAIVYGPAGTAKTPLVCNIQNAVIMAPEPGLLSVRGLTTPAKLTTTRAEILDFIKWFLGSSEAKRFKTFIIDSVSEMSEIILTHYTSKTKHGQQAYGMANKEMLDILRQLYLLKGPNIILTAKQDVYEVEEPSMHGPVFVKHFRPYFPGRELNIKIPHLYDEFWQMCRMRFPGRQGEDLVVRTKGTKTVLARDRSGKLDEFEPPDFNYILQKISS